MHKKLIFPCIYLPKALYIHQIVLNTGTRINLINNMIIEIFLFSLDCFISSFLLSLSTILSSLSYYLYIYHSHSFFFSQYYIVLFHTINHPISKFFLFFTLHIVCSSLFHSKYFIIFRSFLYKTFFSFLLFLYAINKNKKIFYY